MIPVPEHLDWAFIYSNKQLKLITKTSDINHFCKIQHLKCVAHVTRLDNDSLQKQILFSCEQKKFSRNRWVKFERELNLSKEQIQRSMQNKKEFTSLHNVPNGYEIYLRRLDESLYQLVYEKENSEIKPLQCTYGVIKLRRDSSCVLLDILCLKYSQEQFIFNFIPHIYTISPLVRSVLL